MNAWFRSFVALLGAAAVLGASAAPRAVDTFDAHTWPVLQASIDAPVAVVFTTTDCVYCPGVVQQLAQEIRKRKLRATLIAVVMDAAPGDADAQLLRDPHYGPADRLLAFSGQAAVLRHTVNPAWRGVTPYVALLKPKAAPVWVTGSPPAPALAAWAQSER